MENQSVELEKKKKKVKNIIWFERTSLVICGGRRWTFGKDWTC